MPLRAKIAIPLAACSIGLVVGVPTPPVASAAVTAGPVIALTTTGRLLDFAASDPGTVLSSTPISGLIAGEAIVAMDIRPATGQLFAIGVANRRGHVYTLNTSNGEATLVNETAIADDLPLGGRWSLDFNPVVDRMRLVHSTGASYRVNPRNGALVAIDAAIGPASPSAIAYDRNTPSAPAATTMFSIDATDSTLNIVGGVDGVPSDNDGVTIPRGPLGVNVVSNLVGFDIASTGDALATMRTAGATRLFAVDLATGAANVVGVVGDGTVSILDIALPRPPSGAMLALTSADGLVRFDASSPGATGPVIPITGLQPGEHIVGIDVRPSTGEVIGVGILGQAGKVYRIDPVTGGATPLSGGPFAIDLPNGGSWAVDINPVTDRIRLIHGGGLNLRLNPTSGELTAVDVAITGSKATAVAYDRSVTGASETTLYSIDNLTARLNLLGGPDGEPSANSGDTYFRGMLGTTPDTNEVGFDVMANGTALAAMRVAGFTGLFAIDLASGLASPLGTIGSGAVGVIDLAALPPIPEGSSQFTPVSPTRLLDTRELGDKPKRASTLELQVAGVAGVPTNATAVVLNLTATEANDDGFITIFPSGTPRPLASSTNVSEDGTKATLTSAKLGVDGKVNIFVQSRAHLIIDVFGYYSPPISRAGRFTPLTPARLFDSRDPGNTKPGAFGYVNVQVAGRFGVPLLGVSAVIVNLTATEADEPGFIQAYASGTPQPGTSNLNVERTGGTVSNLAVVPVGADGQIVLFTQKGAHLIVDVAGWYSNEFGRGGYSGLFVPVDPSRVLDTRDGTGAAPKPVPALGTIDVTIAGRAGVPEDGVAGVVANLTAVDTAAPGFVTMYPAGTPLALVSSLNVDVVGQIVPNLVASPLSSGGKVSIFHQTGGNLVADVAGWFIA
ncbi:MAG: DUF4394 domain-containing protein [Ilumatobacteraceae bacterium]